MADLLALRNSFRSLILLTTDDVEDSVVDTWINEGLVRVSGAFDWPWLEASADIAITGGNPAGTLPADFARLRTLLLKGERTKLAEISAMEAWERWGDDLPDGTPSVFWFSEGGIKIAPVPSASDTLLIHYYKTPTELSNDTDEPAWADKFHYILSDWALYRGWQREEDHVKAERHLASFEATLSDMVRQNFNQGHDYPIVFGERPDYVQRRVGAANMPWLDGA